MIQQTFEFSSVGEKPKPKATQRKPTQRPTAARQEPKNEPSPTYAKMTEKIHNLKVANEYLRSLLGEQERIVSSLRLQNSLLRAGTEAKANERGALPADMLARLIRLSHPDRHGNSPASNEATAWLLAQRKAR